MITMLKRIFKSLLISSERKAKGSGVKIGKHCDIQRNVSFGSEPYLIEIGDHVQLTTGVKIFTHGGGWVLRQEHPSIDIFGKVKIGNNVYVGNNSLIMPGVSIGNNVVVGAGSIVTKSVPDNSIIAGNPARIIGNFDDYKAKSLKYNVGTKGMNKHKKKKILLSLSDDRYMSKEEL